MSKWQAFEPMGTVLDLKTKQKPVKCFFFGVNFNLFSGNPMAYKKLPTPLKFVHNKLLRKKNH